MNTGQGQGQGQFVQLALRGRLTGQARQVVDVFSVLAGEDGVDRERHFRLWQVTVYNMVVQLTRSIYA